MLFLQFDLGGHDLTQCLMRMLTKSGYSFSTMDEQEVITYTIGEVVLCNSGVWKGDGNCCYKFLVPEIGITAPPKQLYLTWLGSSIILFASHLTFKNTKLQYDETGTINHSLEMFLSFRNNIIVIITTLFTISKWWWQCYLKLTIAPTEALSTQGQ